MGLLILLTMPFIIRRLYWLVVLMMPVAVVCPLITVRSEILILLLLGYLAIELFSAADIHAFCAALSHIQFGSTITVSRSDRQLNEEAPKLFAFFASFTSRPPPVF